MRVLLVEDDELLGFGIRAGLKQDGHVVDWVKDGQSAIHALQFKNADLEKFDIVVLDLGLPKVSGLTVLQTVRKEGITIPVLILTAQDTLNDRVKGLDSGADDYLTKPFEMEELCARLRALQRRFSARAMPVIQYKDLFLDPAAHSIKRGDESISLPRREFALLQKLLENAGHVLSRELLTQSLYGWEEDVDSNTLEVHIHNIRKKVGNDVIRTIRGVGYMVEKET